MKNLPLLLGTLLGTVLLIVGVVFFFSNQQQANLPTEVAPTQLVTDSPHVLGATESAEITIVEFSDFQCPACANTEPLLMQILDQYPSARLIYRHFPLHSIHPNAQLAAQAAEVAAEDGKFWEYHDLLFAQQSAWSAITSRDDLKEQLASYAEELELDKATFLERIESDHIKMLVTEDVTTGGGLNINSTPTIFVNGRPTPASQLSQTIESIINN